MSAALTMTEETPESERMALWGKMEALGDEKLMSKWQTMGELWQKAMQGQVTEEEATAAWMEWQAYLAETIMNVLK